MGEEKKTLKYHVVRHKDEESFTREVSEYSDRGYVVIGYAIHPGTPIQFTAMMELKKKK